MPSEQATAAAEKIRKHEGWEDDADVSEIAAIIDAAFAPVVAERDALLRECKSKLHVIRRRLIGKSLSGDECLNLIYAINALIGREES